MLLSLPRGFTIALNLLQSEVILASRYEVHFIRYFSFLLAIGKPTLNLKPYFEFSDIIHIRHVLRMIKYRHIVVLVQINGNDPAHGVVHEWWQQPIAPVAHGFIALLPALQLQIEQPQLVEHYPVVIRAAVDHHVVAHDCGRVVLARPQHVGLGRAGG